MDYAGSEPYLDNAYMDCKDDPTDDCNPHTGGADCPGVCRGKPAHCNYNKPGVSWVSHDPDTCAVIKFICAEGTVPFSNECGCGCEEVDGEPCNGIVCGEGEYCCNYSCGICAPEGGYCTQQWCG